MVKFLSVVARSKDKIDEYRNGRRRSTPQIDQMEYTWHITTFCQG